MKNAWKLILKAVLVFAVSMVASLLLLTLFGALFKLEFANIWASAFRVSALMELIVIFEWVQGKRKKKKEEQ